jgi:3-dehydroquinate synthase
MLDPANAAALGQDGWVFCLTAQPGEIMARLDHDRQRRPLLDVPEPVERIRELLQRRAEAYGRFHQISTSGQTPEQVALAIMQTIREREQATEGHTLARLSVTHPAGAYVVVVGYDLLPALRQLAGLEGSIAIITDSQVGPLYAARCGPAACLVTIPAGEQYKTLATASLVYGQLLSAGMDRQGTIVALGGGVVGDLAGFVAATYMRGLNFVQCPTTLLAMIDASVGGKTGLDLPQGKNLIGAFKQPAAVIADLAVLPTLPAAEFAAGMAEVIKHGLIAQPQLLKKVGSREWRLAVGDGEAMAELQSLIIDAVQVKRDIVQADPFEQGRRAVLNLGHTFAHAIETVSEYGVGHGQAVAMGLVAAAHLSALLGYCSSLLPERIEGILAHQGLPTRIPAGLAPETLLAAMRSDKKKSAGRLRFVLLRDIGAVFITDEVEEAAVLSTLQARRASGG